MRCYPKLIQRPQLADFVQLGKCLLRTGFCSAVPCHEGKHSDTKFPAVVGPICLLSLRTCEHKYAEQTLRGICLQLIFANPTTHGCAVWAIAD